MKWKKMTNYLIEKGTNYSYLIDAIKNPTFESIRCLPATFVNQLPEEVRTILLESLNNSGDKQDNEALLSMFMFAYGKMHAAKLLAAFENLPADNLTDFHIVDWGCGQAMATLAYYEYLSNKQLTPTIKSITLVEPSELALKRAALHVHKLFPTAEIRTVHKDFDSLSIEDIQIEDNQTVLHFFSNVLEMECFSIEQLAELIKKNKTHNFMVCVSPFVNEYKNQRLYDFIECFPYANTLADYIDSEWTNGWTVDYKVVEVNLDDKPLTHKLIIYPSEPLTDIDGNVYKTVRIGHQIWMAENLRVTRYNSGKSIDSDWEEINDDWINEEYYDFSKGSCCNYGFNPKYDMVYGKLYNWIAVEDDNELAPKGWHVPSIEEWEKLIDYLGGVKYAGKKLKEAGYEHWDNSYENGTNESGFSALPSGMLINPKWFEGLGRSAIWWPSSFGMLSYSALNVGIGNGEVCYASENESMGFAVRCVKDINCEPLIDIDGNSYPTVQIGNQIWMKENLRVSKYRNGDEIPNIVENEEWERLKTGACCNYENNIENDTNYGKLYSWYAVDDKRDLAPEGWHIPSDLEWQTLIDYLGGEEIAGGILKTDYFWHDSILNVTDDYEFSAMPGGGRNGNGSFDSSGIMGFWWGRNEFDSVNSWYIYLENKTNSVSSLFCDKKVGASIRCIKDN